MKISYQLLIGLVLGFLAYYAYDFKRSINQQVEHLQLQAKVEALMPLCPKVFETIVKKEEPKK